jgi:glycerol-3-phosphate dehydrogenase (NAD(P)+)
LIQSFQYSLKQLKTIIFFHPSRVSWKSDGKRRPDHFSIQDQFMHHVAFIGTGGFATSLAIHLNRLGRSVCLWGRDAEYCRIMAATRINTRHLPDVPIPADILITGEISLAVAEAELVIAATPTAHLRQTLHQLAGQIPAGIPILSVVKGLEIGTLNRPSEIIRQELGDREVAVLSGPSHAEEVAKGRPTSLVIASQSPSLAGEVQRLFGSRSLRLYLNDDPLGVELAGALKNIMGIAAGVCDGLGLGDNAKAALITRGLVEMTRFAVAQGASFSTFFGLAGVGDLMTTCFSGHGRNRAMGGQLARGMTLEQAQNSTMNVVEGVYTARSVAAAARIQQIEMPITEAVEKIIDGRVSARQAVEELMSRPSGMETYQMPGS